MSAARFSTVLALLLATPAQAADVTLVDGTPAGPIPGVSVVPFGGEVTAQGDAHARGVAGLIGERAPRLRVRLLAALPVADEFRDERVAAAVRAAGRRGGVVNLSLGKPWEQPLTCAAIRARPRALFVTASGNDGLDLSAGTFDPATCGAANQLVVEASAASSNTGGDVSADWTSTSGAAAIATATISTVARRLDVPRTARGVRVLRRTAIRSGLVRARMLRLVRRTQ